MNLEITNRNQKILLLVFHHNISKIYLISTFTSKPCYSNAHVRFKIKPDYKSSPIFEARSVILYKFSRSVTTKCCQGKAFMIKYLKKKKQCFTGCGLNIKWVKNESVKIQFSSVIWRLFVNCVFIILSNYQFCLLKKKS